jgi:predicted permease
MQVPSTIRYAVRPLTRKPMFAAGIIFTLAICIGAVTAVFSVVDATLLRPLPYPEPERLAQIVVRSRVNNAEGLQQFQNGATWQQLSKSVQSMDLAVYRSSTENLNFSSSEKTGYIRQQRVGAGFFRVFGPPLYLGREFTPEEDIPGGPPLVILSYDFWRRAAGSDPGIVNRTMAIAGVIYGVVGVASAKFESKADVWTPLHPSTRGEGQGLNYVITGRVRKGSTWEQADAEIASAGDVLIQQRRFDSGVTARYSLMSLQEATSGYLASSLWTILAVTILVLIAGCVNIAGMLMAQTISRRSEIATRMAIGASRTAIVRQLFNESVAIATTAGAFGILFGHWTLEAMKQILPPAFSALQAARLDLRVVAATAVTSGITAVIFGLLPAFQAIHVDIRSAQGSRAVAGASISWPRRALSVLQVAIAVVVLIAAGLLLHSFKYLANLDPGLDASNVITANFALLDSRYASAANAARYFDEVLERLHNIPGVEAAAVTHSLPYERGMNTVFGRPGDPPDTTPRLTNYAYVSPQFFQALRIPVLIGRAITNGDRPGAGRVVVINKAFASLYFKGEDPVGTHIRAFGEDREIVGVVGDVLQQAGWGRFGPMGRVPTFYIPAAQPGPAGLLAPSPSWIVRTSLPPSAVQKQIEAAVAGVDPLLPIASFRSLNEINLNSLALQRFMAVLLQIAAGLALLLAAVGTFAMIANCAAERTREFGIRMALGSTTGRAIRNCASSGVVCSVAGLTLGLLIARFATRYVQSMLYGVSPLDPPTYLIVGTCVLMITALASVIPALRIARLDPAQILRHE